jgi:response regulator RpfG family c-di-GMP phosphodiesterase
MCFLYLNYQSGQKEKEAMIILNVFGKQKMYTQMIAKDASSLYAMVQALENKQSYQTKENLKQKILETKISLAHEKQEFANTITSLHNGYLFIDAHGISIKDSIGQDSKDLKALDESWLEYEKYVDVLIYSDGINEEMANATIYINENNLELMKLCDNLLKHVEKASINASERLKLISYLLIGLLGGILVVTLYSLIQHVFLPFHQLYKGVVGIGVNQNLKQSKFLTKNKMVPIVSDIDNMFHKINNLITLIENINNNASFTETLNFINETFSAYIPYNYIGIALIEEDKKLLRASYGVADDNIVGLPENLVGSTWPINDTSLESLLQTGEARIINDLEEYTAKKPLKPYNAAILEAGIRASITLPLKVSGEPVGVIFFSSNRKNVYNEEHLKFLNSLVNSIAISFNQNIFIKDVLYSSVLALAKLAEARDEDTGEHLNRMKHYSKAITELLYENSVYADEITVEYIENIERYSPLHDIGKVGIRDGILLKPGKLTTEEFEEMKQHTKYGADVLRSAENNMQKRGKSLFNMGIEIAESHHEKWDGSGYPYGKKEKEIPLCARIVAIADVFDALTSKRPYKEPFSLEVSFGIIEEGRGKHFDPYIIDILMANQDRFIWLYHSLKLTQKDTPKQIALVKGN